MNWMIDGMYGDLYRTAMGYRQLGAHHNAPEERLSADTPHAVNRPAAGIRKVLMKGRAVLEATGFNAATKERTVS